MADVIVKGRRLAAANSKWKVYFDHLVDKQGNEVHDYLVLDPVGTHANLVAGVSVLPVIDDDVVLIRSYRHALGVELWEVPRGFVESDEAPAHAALRELTEESGLSCEPANLVPLGLYAPEPSTMVARGALFAATRCTGTLLAARDEIGLVALHRMSFAEMARLIATGAIEDASTVILYHRYAALRGRG